MQLFDAADGIDPELMEMMNDKISIIKEKFTEWQVKQMDYTSLLKKKLYMYDSLAKEFHGIVSMPLQDIFHGVKLMDEEASNVWNAIIDNLGHEYFLPIISKTYAHLFINDTKRHSENMAAKIDETIINEREILKQCTKQVASMKEELDDQSYHAVKERLGLAEDLKKAEETHHRLGYDTAAEESRLKIEELESELKDLKGN